MYTSKMNCLLLGSRRWTDNQRTSLPHNNLGEESITSLNLLASYDSIEKMCYQLDGYTISIQYQEDTVCTGVTSVA